MTTDKQRIAEQILDKYAYEVEGGYAVSFSDAVEAMNEFAAHSEQGWVSVSERLPESRGNVLAWVHLAKNPSGSGEVIASYCFCEKDEPEDYGEMRMTAGCWWGLGRYLRPNTEGGYVTHWRPLPVPPVQPESAHEEKL